MKITKADLKQIIKEELTLNTDFKSAHFSSSDKKNNIVKAIENARMKLEIVRGELSAELGNHATVDNLLEIIIDLNNFLTIVEKINDADEMVRLMHADFMSKAKK